MDDIKYKVDFHLGCKVEIEGGDENEEYEVLFFDNEDELKFQIQLYKPDFMIVGDEYKDKKVIGSEFSEKLIFFEKYTLEDL